MALINCKECGKEISSQAITCPNCGYSIKSQLWQNITAVNADKEYSVGQTYQDASIAIKFISLDDNFIDYDYRYSHIIKNEHQIIKAEFEFENFGTSDRYIAAVSFKCYADNYNCEAFWNIDDMLFTFELSTGKKAKGCVYFQVPINATTITLEYELTSWTNSKAIFKVK